MPPCFSTRIVVASAVLATASLLHAAPARPAEPTPASTNPAAHDLAPDKAVAALIQDDQWPAALQRVDQQLADHPRDFRLAYLRGVILHHTQPHGSAATEQFLAVLDLPQETQAPPSGSAADEMLPPAAAALVRQTHAQQRALSSLRFPRPPQGYHPDSYATPASLTDAQDRATVWLRLRAEQMDAQSFEQLVHQLETRGQPLARLLLNLSLIHI